MREPPALNNSALEQALNSAYALPVHNITFIPMGDDATAWVYRVQTVDRRRYLLKVKYGRPTAASLLVPHYLHTHGFPEVVAPLPTRTDELAQPHGKFTLILYPFITGETGMAQGLRAEQWTRFGHLLRRLHTTQLPPMLVAQLPRETFASPFSHTVRKLDRLIAQGSYADHYQAALATFWQSRRAQIVLLVERMETLAHQLQAETPALVLCHADIHTANLLVDHQGALHIVDWDGVLLAPRERDLIFVMERAVIQQETEHNLFSGYGEVTVNPLAFAYYRYLWVTQEFADYGSRVFLAKDIGTVTKQAAVDEFRRLFAPGDVIDVALATEQDLSR